MNENSERYEVVSLGTSSSTPAPSLVVPEDGTAMHRRITTTTTVISTSRNNMSSSSSSSSSSSGVFNEEDEEIFRQVTQVPESYSNITKIEAQIEEVISSVNSVSWQFQKHVDRKAREHVKNMIQDTWIGVNQKRDKKRKNNTTTTTTTNGEDIVKNEVTEAVLKCGKSMLYEYERWCRVAKQPFNIGKQPEEVITALLMLLMVFGEIDLIRSQNRSCLLLFHVAWTALQTPTTSQPVVHTSVMDQIENEPETVSIPRVDSIASLVNREARYIYNLLGQTFDKNLRNEEFFDWDDLNDLCWTPGFVQNFLTVTDDNVYTIGGFDKAFNMTKYPTLRRLILDSKHQLKDDTEEKKLKKEKKKFAHNWKTYFDRAGGILGWRGYLTYFLNFYPMIYYQLFCLFITVAWLLDFGLKMRVMDIIRAARKGTLGRVGVDYVHLGVAGAPLVAALLYFIARILFSQRTKPSIFHAHRFTIPRRDSLFRHSEFKFSNFKFVNIIPGFVLSLFHRHHFTTLLMLCLLTASYICLLRYALFETVRGITFDALRLFEQLANDHATMASREIANTVLVLVCFVLLWISLLFVFTILPPILLSIWVGIFGFIKGLYMGSSRINCWSDVKRCFNDKNLILRHFRKKLLADSTPLKECDTELTECAWATVWNGIIEDFYDNHQCSKAERNRLSYKLKLVGSQLKIVGTPDLSLRPVNAEMRHHLIRFINNMYMRSMPSDNVKVIDMKRLVVFTPVYKEKVFYSWEELVQPNNTNNSFLRALIIKFPADWKNFKDKEFPEGNRLRKTVDYIEGKVLAGVDITQHTLQKVTTTQFMKTKIQSWASQRFQPVSRTVKGFMKTPKALSILLRLQNPELSDEQVKKIIRQKFSYVIGAQLYDESMWRSATGYDKLNHAEKLENDLEHAAYVQGLDYLSKTVGDNMLKLAFMKRERVVSSTQTSDEPEYKYKSILRIYNGDTPVNLYEVDSYGDFSKLGQGKPTNQGFMLQFFDGSYCQTIDCNMESTLAQSFFVPNALKEFDKDKRVMIVGFPEYLTTRYWSYAGYAAAFTERIFGSIVQRVWSMMNLRFHYGHPDFLRGSCAMFTTGLSKLSYISEDIFSGFDVMLSGGKSIHVEYMEVGKARDVCMISTTKFNRKTAGGAAQIVCSRYPNWILTSRHFTIIDKIFFCYSIISHYSNTLFTILAAFVLYTTRVLILILILITIKATRIESILDLYATVLDISGTMSIMTDSLFLFQMGMALSIPGILQNILDRGLVRGIYEYLVNLVYLLLYSMFQLMNTFAYFHYGFNHSAKYIASGRVTGLQHTSITEIFRTFKDTHFYPALVMLILQIIGISLGGSVLFFVFHSILIFIWIFSPFIFNEGSIPMNVSKNTWEKLYAEDNYRVKYWLRNDCAVKNVDRLIAKQDVERHAQMEYVYSTAAESDDLELDLELNLMNNRPDKSHYERDYSDRMYSLVHLQSQIQRKRAAVEEKPLLIKERTNEGSQNHSNQLPDEGVAVKKLKKYGKRYRLLHFFVIQPLLLIRYLFLIIPKLYLLLILWGTKIISYVYLLYKMIAPWTSPPGYIDAYRKEYEEKIIESRLMNIQRVFWFLKKDMASFMELSKVKVKAVGLTTSATPKDSDLVLRKDLAISAHQKKLEQERLYKICDMSSAMLYESILNYNTIFANENEVHIKRESYDRMNCILSQALDSSSVSLKEFLDLAVRASELLFLNAEPSTTNLKHRLMSPTSEDTRRHNLLVAMTQFDLFPHYERFSEHVDNCIREVDLILSKGVTQQKVSRATQLLVAAGNFIVIENQAVFDKIFYTPDTSLNGARKHCKNLLLKLISKSTMIAEKYMLQAKKDYEVFCIKLHQNNLFDSQARNITYQRNSVRTQLEQALNYAKRLTDAKYSRRHVQVTQFSSNMMESQILVSDAFEGDSGNSIFSQICPIYSDCELQLPELTDSRRNEIQHDKLELLDALTSELNQRLVQNQVFVELESNCLDMVEFMEQSDDSDNDQSSVSTSTSPSNSKL